LDLDLRERCAALVDRSGSTQPFGLYVVASTDPAAELGRVVERVVFEEFFDNSPALLDEEYDPYEPASMFLCVIDQRRLVPAGVMRLIVPSAAGLKTLDDIERVWGARADDVIARSGTAIDRGRCWDVATFAITDEYRGAATEGLVSLSLYQALVLTARAADVPWFVAVLDVKVLDAIDERMGNPFTRFPGLEPLPYLDSPASRPVFVDLDGYQPRIAALDMNLHDIMFRGTGLEAAVWTPDWVSATRAALPVFDEVDLTDALDLTDQMDSQPAERGAARLQTEQGR
jgi:hypothetical protein